MTNYAGFYSPAIKLSESDYEAAAKLLVCDVPAIKAVAEVEGVGSGFLADSRPKILFESYQFHKFTSGKYTNSHPHLSTSSWIRNYKGGALEYDRLYEAMNLDDYAALKACSWGMFQIMGFNCHIVGCLSIEDFIHQCCFSESAHLQSFCMFVLNNDLDGYLRNHQWAIFARGYNGPGYEKNHYDTRLATAYAKYNEAVPKDSDIPVTLEAQIALNKWGTSPELAEDGILGRATTGAVENFQRAHGLKVDGVVGRETWSELKKYI